ncbi:MAG: SufD family Fe-S cluster assembly protein [Patescibacteria group bacterium]
MNTTFLHLEDTIRKKIVLKKKGVYIIFFHNLSGNLVCEIKASRVDLTVVGLYTGNKMQEFTLTTTQHHFSPFSRSRLLIKGIFDGMSKFKYSGRIRIEKKAKGTHASQKNQNLVISENTLVDTEPCLEIMSDDVFCTHSATTIQPERDSLFYFASKGIKEKKAQKLILRGFIEELFEFFPPLLHNKQIIKLKNSVLTRYD